MSKRKECINVINLLYRHFILQHDVLTTKQEAYSFSQVVTSFTEMTQIEKMLTNLSYLIVKINQYLKPGWNFVRLSNYHKAILMHGVYEIYYEKLSKAIVINESLEILKLYSEDTDFSYINSVLDKF